MSPPSQKQILTQEACEQASLLERLGDFIVKPFVTSKTDEEVLGTQIISKPEDVLESLRAEKGNLPEFADIERRYKHIMDSLGRQAEGLCSSDAKVHLSDGGNESTLSNTGGKYVFLDRKLFTAALLSDEVMPMLEDMAGHEFSHLKNRDTSPWNTLIRANFSYVAEKSEIIADIEGAGPLGTHDPTSMARYFSTQLVFQTRNYLKTEEMPSFDQMKDFSALQAAGNPLHHPEYMQRIAYLQREAVLMKEYESALPVVTHDDRVKEAEWLKAKILQEIKDQTLPVAVIELPKFMDPLPMTTVENIAAPAAPSASKQRERE